MSRVGIYSGTFDPIHNGHLAFAQAALDKGLVDKVCFLVEESPRSKQNVTPLKDRMNMAWLAIHNNPRFELIMVDQPTFSIKETLPLLEKSHGKLALLMGSDQAAHVHTWPDYEQLKNDTKIIVGQRSIQKVDDGFEHIASSKIRHNPKVSQTLIPRDISRYIQAHHLYESVVNS
jgi:nicotinate-nucleotide adenylyltransferase